MKKIEWTLRIAMFGEFLGHGVFAYQAAPHFRLLVMGSLGVSEETAATVLPVIGIIDLTIAALVLVKPIRAVLLWGAIWGLLTGLARPLSGREIWDSWSAGPIGAFL